jgi:HupE / UreJ protein
MVRRRAGSRSPAPCTVQRVSRKFRAAVAAAALAVAAFPSATPALAHGLGSTVYLHISAGGDGHVRTTVELEYGLLVVSAADAAHDDPLFRAGTAAFDAGDTGGQAAALNTHRDTAAGYVTSRLSVAADGKACTPAPVGDVTMGVRENVPYADLLLDWHCPERSDGHEVRSGLFPDAEGYVAGTKTIVTYAIDGRSGSAALDSGSPSFSTAQPWYQRFWEFFRLGAEHLLTGIDHLLFLLALIAGSRRPREILLAATSFTLAHSVTFMLAALGLVAVPARAVEPVIALSIAVVAGWHLWQIRRDRDQSGRRPEWLSRFGFGRLAVVFSFGLVHGLGFAGALGIDAAWSWTLLWSLLVFNLGIETVQLAAIGAVFPLLVLLRRRSPRAARWATGVIAAGVSIMGLIWFVQRLFVS